MASLGKIINIWVLCPVPSLISKGVWLISYNIMNDWRLSYLIIHFIWTSLIKWTFVHSTYMPLVVMIFMRCSWVSYNLFIYLFKRSKYFLHSLATYQLHHRALNSCSSKQFWKSHSLNLYRQFGNIVLFILCKPIFTSILDISLKIGILCAKRIRKTSHPFPFYHGTQKC